MKKSLWLAGVLALTFAATACAENAENAAPDANGAVDAASASDTAAAAGLAASTAAAAAQVEPAPEAAPDFEFPDEAWRPVDPEDTLYIDTDHGMIVIELAPEFAPLHVERMTTLARNNFYDFLVWHRVIDGFVAQGGGSRANPNHGTDLPNVPGEFTIRRGPEMEISELQMRTVNPRQDPRDAPAGFWNGFPAGTSPIVQASITGDGQVDSWLLHCTGAASMARTSDPNSAGSQFYITRGNAEHLNTQYTVWGRVRHGQDAVDAIAVGTMGEDMGFTPDTIRSMRVGSDLPEGERLGIEVVDTASTAFAEYLDSLRNADGELPDVCDIPLPTRVTE